MEDAPEDSEPDAREAVHRATHRILDIFREEFSCEADLHLRCVVSSIASALAILIAMQPWRRKDKIKYYARCATRILESGEGLPFKDGSESIPRWES